MSARANVPSACVPFGTYSVRVDCDFPALCAALALHLRSCPCLDGPHVATYRIDSRSDAFHLSHDGEALFESISEDDLLAALMNDVITRLIEPCADRLLFHAAGVTLADCGILLCGVSGSGKSTLTAWLIQQGFDYLTDELTAITLTTPDDTPRMTGMARSLVLKPGAAFVWRSGESNSDQVRCFVDGSAWVPPEALRTGCVRTEAVPRLVIFPRYDANAEFAVRPLSRAQTAFALMQHLVNARNLPDCGFPTVTRLAASLSGYDIVYSDAAMVARWLR